MTRPLHMIANEIFHDWRNMPPYAAPYVKAMLSLRTIYDDYYHETGRSIVNYFLANAGTWRGETARRIKAELREVVDSSYKR